jgi:phage N-6-adenine-methyltransferase
MTQAELDTAEQVIASGLRTFVEVGNALLAIRDQRGYKLQGFSAFDDYCRERWGMSKTNANRLIQSAEVVAILTPIGVSLPTAESQLRPLAGLTPDQRREAWALAVETAPDGKVTAAHVERVVETTKTGMAVHFSSESDEWYTPRRVIDALVGWWGQIDLDPCSNSLDTPNVPAKHHMTSADNGLSLPWLGKVYMNPPYGREIAEWVEYLCDQYERGNIAQAVALVPSRTDTEWFSRMRDFPRCFIRGRLSFIGGNSPAPFPSVLVYLGKDVDGFVSAFGDMGDVYSRIG